MKDLIGFLRISENPRDEMAWFRVLHLLDGVGPATASRAVSYVREHRNDPRTIAGFDAPSAAKEGMKDLGKLLADLISKGMKNPASQRE